MNTNHSFLSSGLDRFHLDDDDVADVSMSNDHSRFQVFMDVAQAPKKKV